MHVREFENQLFGALVGDSTLAGLETLPLKKTAKIRRVVRKVSKKTMENLPIYALAGEIYCSGLSGFDFKSAGVGIASGAAQGAVTGGPIGAVVGAAIGALKAVLGKKKDRDGEAFRTFEKVYNQASGSQFEEQSFELAFNGMREWYDNNKKVPNGGWGPNYFYPMMDADFRAWGRGGGSYQIWMLYKIANAIKNGTLALPTDANAAFNSVIYPALKIYPAMDDMLAYPPLRALWVGTVDRILSDMPVGETARNARQEHDTLSNVLKKLGWAPPSATPVATVQPVPAAPTLTNLQAAQSAASSAVANQALPITPAGYAGTTSSISPGQATAAITANAIAQDVSQVAPVTDATAQAIANLAAQISQSGMSNPPVVNIASPASPVPVATASLGGGFDIQKYWPILALGAGALIFMRRR